VATDEPKPLIAPAPTRDAAQPAAVAPLPDPRQELEQAARRLRAGDADARAAGRAMLQRLRREHFGSALAEQAWDLLLADRQAEQHQEPAPGPNAEITRLTAKVATLTSLAAAALADVLSDLFHPSVPAAPADATRAPCRTSKTAGMICIRRFGGSGEKPHMGSTGLAE